MREKAAKVGVNSTAPADRDRVNRYKKFAARRLASPWIARGPRPGARAFRLLMLGSSISMLGSRISTIAFPMLILRLNNSPVVTGLVGFAVIAPSMLVYMPAGALVDHWNPRRVMLASEFLRGFAIASVVIALVVFGMHITISFLIIVMVAEEILEIFSTLADRRYLNRLTKRDSAADRQASVEVRAHAAVLAGRPVGPVLFSIDPFLPFLADAISFIVSVSSLLLLGRLSEPPSEVLLLWPRRMIGEIRQGFKWLRRDHRALVALMVMALTSMAAQALILTFLVEAHSKQLTTVAIGAVLAASGAGGAVGAFCARFVPAALRAFWPQIQMIAWSATFAALVVSDGQSSYWNAGAMFILGLTGAIGNVEFGTYLVKHLRDDMIGKVTAFGQMLSMGACALGPVLGGYATQQFGVRGAMAFLFGVVLTGTLVSMLMAMIIQGSRKPSSAAPSVARRPALTHMECECRTGNPSGPVGAHPTATSDHCSLSHTA